jgi:peptide/nickel transport system substrate-binding protein
MKNNRWLSIVWTSIMLVSLILGTAGCSGMNLPFKPTEAAQPSEPTAPPAPAATQVETTAVEAPTTEAPVAPAQPAGKSSITLVIPEDPPSFNAIVGDTGYDGLVMNLVLLGLTGVDADGTAYPELAAELPTLENGGVVADEAAGTMDVTWKLRKDVKWVDGKPVTADDVVFTWEAIMNPDTGIWVRGSDYVDSVEKVDDYTVVFHYNSIYPGYLIQLGWEQLVIWPAHYCDAQQGFVAWDCASKPLSDGPYILKEWNVGDHLTFERNATYFETGKPAIDEITVRIIPEETVRKQMMVQGEADLYMWATESVIVDLAKAPNVQISSSPTGRWVMRLFPNQAAKGKTDSKTDPHPFLSDVRVRQAIRAAIDVDTIVNLIFQGYDKPIWTEFYRKPYECEIPRPVYQPEQAKQILEQAGWKDTNGDGYRECSGCTTAKEGTPMTLDFYTYSEYGEPLQLTQQYIADNLKKIGIKAELNSFEGSVMWADPGSGGIEQNGDFELDLWDDGYSSTDPTDYLWELYASEAATPGNGWNIVRWQNEEFNALLGEAYTLDEAKRKDIFCQMAKILDEQVPVILLFSTVNADAYSIRLSGIRSNINDLVTWNVADWKILP